MRTALVVFTAFAIGFPIWYRWPYEEAEILSAGKVENKRITTWQRQWGGGRLKHWTERQVLGGKTVSTMTYRNGLRHGSYVDYRSTGQYANDKKEGVWVDRTRIATRSYTWHLDQLDGPAKIEWPDGRKVDLLFTAGRLTHFNGKPTRNRLYDLIEKNAIEPQIAAELRSPTEISFIKNSLYDDVQYLKDRHGVSIMLDPKVPALTIPIAEELRDIELCSVLTWLTTPLGLGCDYRYGCIWITTAADAEDWHDPTGVADLKPPRGSSLARAWNEPAELIFFDTPLKDILAYLADRMGIRIEFQPLPSVSRTSTIPVRMLDVKGRPFYDCLGITLYLTGCRCKLDGDTLVILPPEGN